MRLVLEVRLAGLPLLLPPPISVAESAGTGHQAINGGAHRLTRAVDSAVGKRCATHRRLPDRADPAIFASQSEVIPGADDV